MHMSEYRYDSPLPDLLARFVLKKGLFRKEQVEASVYELSRFGCVIKTDKWFEPGDTMALELEMMMPFENLRANGLTGLVTERKKYCSNFFYSIDFIEGDNRPRSMASGQLARIRDVLDRKQQLLARREGASIDATA